MRKMSDMLLYAELELKYNPSESAPELYGMLSSIANHPEKKVVSFSIEYVSP